MGSGALQGAAHAEARRAAGAAAVPTPPVLLLPARPLQTRLAPPFPALRLALLLNLIALAALLALEAAAAAARWLRVRLAPWARRRRGTSSGGERGAAGEQGTTPVEGKSGSCSGGGAGAVTGAAAGPLQLGEVNGADAACEEQQQQGRSAPGDPLARGDTLYGRRDGAPQRPGVPDVYLQRGLSRRVRSLQDRRPRAVRLGALALLSATYALGSTSQIAAAGYIDASLLQLVMMFTVVGERVGGWGAQPPAGVLRRRPQHMQARRAGGSAVPA